MSVQLYQICVPASVLLGVELTSFPDWGGELEEGLCCVSLQGCKEPAVPIVAHREELGASLRACQLSFPLETVRWWMCITVTNCNSSVLY